MKSEFVVESLQTGILPNLGTFSTGISNVTSTVKYVSLFPNPNNGQFAIKGVLEGCFGSILLNVINAIGQVVYTDITIPTNGAIDKEIDLTALPKGVYLAQISADNVRKSISFIIQ